jgi:hypothetical protein
LWEARKNATVFAYLVLREDNRKKLEKWKETSMRTIFAFAFFIAGTSLAAAAPLNDADCTAVWKLVDVDDKGSVDAEHVKSYIANFAEADVDKNGAIDAGEFKAACKAGLVKK